MLHNLAQLTFQSGQAFRTLATRMIGNGLIERVDGPGRAVRHLVTEKGAQLFLLDRLNGTLADNGP